MTRVSVPAAELIRSVTARGTSSMVDVTERGHELQLRFMRAVAIDTLADINVLRGSIVRDGAALKRLASASMCK